MARASPGRSCGSALVAEKATPVATLTTPSRVFGDMRVGDGDAYMYVMCAALPWSLTHRAGMPLARTRPFPRSSKVRAGGGDTRAFCCDW